jgi:hypothetical protein
MMLAKPGSFLPNGSNASFRNALNLTVPVLFDPVGFNVPVDKTSRWPDVNGILAWIKTGAMSY